MTTKNFLTPIDLDNPEKNFNDFLYPVKYNDEFVFKGIKSGKIWKRGVVSFVGISLNKNDVFAKIVDSKIYIDDVKGLLDSLEKYIEQIKNLPLGTVTSIESNGDGFIIKSLGKQPRIKHNRIP